MVEPGRGCFLYPSKHRVVVRPAGEFFRWELKSPAGALIAQSEGSKYTRARDAERAAKIFFKTNRVEILLMAKVPAVPAAPAPEEPAGG